MGASEGGVCSSALRYILCLCEKERETNSLLVSTQTKGSPGYISRHLRLIRHPSPLPPLPPVAFFLSHSIFFLSPTCNAPPPPPPPPPLPLYFSSTPTVQTRRRSGQLGYPSSWHRGSDVSSWLKETAFSVCQKLNKKKKERKKESVENCYYSCNNLAGEVCFFHTVVEISRHAKKTFRLTHTLANNIHRNVRSISH